MNENNVVVEKEKPKKNKKKIVVFIVVLFVVLLAVILFFMFYKPKDDKNTIDTEVKEVYSEYRMSGNQLENFDLRFLQLENNGQNVVYSPLSIKYALAMLQEGTGGTSKAQLEALIGDYQAKKYTNSANMSFGNAMFIRNIYQDKIKEDYISRLKEEYNAEVVYDAFENADNVNSWVSEKTFGLINQLIDDVSDKQFMLINALAIDMEWNNLIQATSATMRNSYSVNYAHERYSAYIPFINGDDYGTVKFNNDTINAKAVEIGASINNYDIVNTLGEENIRATITEEYQKWLNSADRYNCSGEIEENVEAYVNQYIEELDSNYQQVKGSTDFKMYVDDSVKMFAKELKEYNGTSLEYIGIMPQNQTLSDFIKNTNATTLSQMMDQLKTIESRNFEEGKITKITGGIPLFQYEYELNLMSDLKNLGVTDVFDESKADLSGITDDENIVIADAKHKANIEFSNEGIKASAATSMSGAGGAGCGFEYLYEVPVVEIDLTFDNPYLYIIRDKNSKEVWFIGTVYQPTVNTNNNARVINGNQ